MSRTASKTRSVAPRTLIISSGMRGLARLGWFPFKWRSGLRLGNLVGAGLGFRGNGIAWLLTRGLVLLFAEPLRGVELRLDGRGRGLGFGWGAAAVGNQSFDRYDHRKGLGAGSYWTNQSASERIPATLTNSLSAPQKSTKIRNGRGGPRLRIGRLGAALAVGEPENRGPRYAFYVYNYALCVHMARSTLSFQRFGQACSQQRYFNPITGGS